MFDYDTYMREWGAEHLCPLCGGPAEWESDCAGYSSSYYHVDGTLVESVMVCHPPCGGAVLFQCVDRMCGWWLRDPNNRSTTLWNIDRKEDVAMGVEPTWLEEARHMLEPSSDYDMDEDRLDDD